MDRLLRLCGPHPRPDPPAGTRGLDGGKIILDDLSHASSGIQHDKVFGTRKWREAGGRNAIRTVVAVARFFLLVRLPPFPCVICTTNISHIVYRD